MDLKKRHFKLKFKFRLFLSVAGIFLFIALFVSLLFSMTSLKNAKENDYRGSAMVLERISSQIASLYEQMDVAATSITKNSTLRGTVLNLNIRDSQLTQQQMMEELEKTRTIQKTLINMMFSPIISNVLLYNRNLDYFYYTGLYLHDEGLLKRALSSDRSFEQLMEARYDQLYLGPHLSPWSGDDKVVLALSGGVDSSVAAVLLHKAIGKNLYCIFVDSGLLRKHEFEDVLESYKNMGLNVKGVKAGDKFLGDLAGVSDPETKRKIIGRDFVEVFNDEAIRIEDVRWLAQGTIYPDVIESVSVNGPSATIKSHHNVGGLPEKMHLGIVEPLRLLFKDEVRRVGRQLNIPMEILGRHPFPGPGLGIRILGEVTAEKVRVLQEADKIFIDNLKEAGLYDKVWQAGVMLLPVQSVGVMGDERTYENCVALRAVTSTDGMTADWVHLPYEFLAKVSNEIINRVKGINRVVYDISSKPPATIEWE